MKLVGAISTAVLSFTLGVGIPAYAQQEQHDRQEENKEKPAHEKEKKAQPGKQEEKNAHQQDKNNKQEEKSAQQQDRNNRQEGKNTQQQHARNGRIPDDRYRTNFGQAHRFRVSQGDYNNRRFQYGGYSFGFVDAWPSNWLYTQDVFVIELDGVYYLCNASYPGVNITLNVIL
jgi:hypothetical protein